MKGKKIQEISLPAFLTRHGANLNIYRQPSHLLGNGRTKGEIQAQNHRAMKYECNQQIHCLECGENLSGRSDKLFCSLPCKNSFNNRRHKIKAAFIKETQKNISRNYSILEMLLTEKMHSISIDEITRLGFDCSLSTGFSLGTNRRIKYRCYDISYFQSLAKVYGIRREDISAP